MIKKLSIIVLAKDELDNLRKIIPKLKKLSSDVLLIDGHSNDQTKKFCKQNNIKFFYDNKIGTSQSFQLL